MTELAGLGPPAPLLLSAVCYCCRSGHRLKPSASPSDGRGAEEPGQPCRGTVE